jgi:signal recognition particle GTPase
MFKRSASTSGEEERSVDKELVRIKAIISSMTDDDRRHPERFVFSSWEEVVEGGKRRKKRSAFYDQNRVRRVARGAGRKESEVADILNRFAMRRQLMMQLGASTGLLGKIPGLQQFAQMKRRSRKSASARNSARPARRRARSGRIAR